MITEYELKNLKDNDGMTLKNYKPVNYKSGYQVSIEDGIATKSLKKAIKKINEYKGNCGVWKSNNIYYIDYSKRISTKKEAVKIGIEKNQLSILKWANKSLIWIS